VKTKERPRGLREEALSHYTCIIRALMGIVLLSQAKNKDESCHYVELFIIIRSAVLTSIEEVETCDLTLSISCLYVRSKCAEVS
jgi:hypothetical protein